MIALIISIHLLFALISKDSEMKNLFAKIFLVAIVLIGSGMVTSLSAAPNPPPAPSAGAPIDTAVILLLILGTVYGVFKIYGNKKAA
jgi:hypothetical protein